MLYFYLLPCQSLDEKNRYATHVLVRKKNCRCMTHK